MIDKFLYKKSINLQTLDILDILANSGYNGLKSLQKSIKTFTVSHGLM